MNATKQQLIDFISANFVTPEGDHPSKTQLDAFKKDELAQVVTDANVEKELDSYVASF